MNDMRPHNHTTPGPDCDLKIHTADPKPRLRNHMIRDHYAPSGWAMYATLAIVKECHNFEHGLDAFGNRLEVDPRLAGYTESELRYDGIKGIGH